MPGGIAGRPYAMKLKLPERVLSLDSVALMGVLNVTPDSFSDGGRWFDEKSAIARALQMVADGAAIIDVGGESTRPGAEPVSEREELRRVLPVIEAVVAGTDVPVSIDTRKPGVARRAVAAGAEIVNDTSGEDADIEMDEVVAETQAAAVVMHSRGTPATMRTLTEYDDVVDHVATFLCRRGRELEDRGVPAEAIVVDPGFGFAKTVEQNIEMLRRFDEFARCGYAVLAGTSRKSFIGRLLDLPVEERVEATAATVAWTIWKGARLVRVHDVAHMARTARMIELIVGSK